MCPNKPQRADTGFIYEAEMQLPQLRENTMWSRHNISTEFKKKVVCKVELDVFSASVLCRFCKLKLTHSLMLFSLLASDYGMRLPILRSSPEDQILYQTERYNEDTFGYDVPIREEGEYILVMKYAEVYFAQSQQKV